MNTQSSGKGNIPLKTKLDTFLKQGFQQEDVMSNSSITCKKLVGAALRTGRRETNCKEKH